MSRPVTWTRLTVRPAIAESTIFVTPGVEGPRPSPFPGSYRQNRALRCPQDLRRRRADDGWVGEAAMLGGKDDQVRRHGARELDDLWSRFRAEAQFFHRDAAGFRRNGGDLGRDISLRL